MVAFQLEGFHQKHQMSFPNSFYREAIFYCGMSAHNFQFHEFAIEKYQNDNDWLEKTCGVSIQNCVTISKVISDRVLENINSTRSVKIQSSKDITDGNFLINLFKFNISDITKTIWARQKKLFRVL